MNASSAMLLVLAFPIAGALLNAFFGRRFAAGSGWLATGCAAAALATGAPAALHALRGTELSVKAWTFFATEGLSVDVAFRLDRLSAVMFFVVLGVGTLIHLYSIEYMAEDRSRPRFFAYLNMFIAFMLVLVLADNLFMLFVGWEGVGLASYCLIGFWYERPEPRKAAVKAFITNRIGDAAFLLGLLFLALLTGTASFPDIGRFFAQSDPDFLRAPVSFFGRDLVSMPNLIALLLFLGACGKSAQFPLHVWLPDAMEGPTPVSALIHAATMVTAGVYMVARLDPVFVRAEATRELMLGIAVLTACGAAVAAWAQVDLKRILAYSTISQLGYMMAAVAVGSRGTAIFHLATHAVFKALLFLGAGSVMHALHGELDIRRMGRLAKRIPGTTATFIIGAAGLSGVAFTAGFYSKDAILVSVGDHHPFAAALLFLGALVTAIYSTRMVVVAFFGASDRLDHHTAERCHESGAIILMPLILLAIGTLVVGHLPIPGLLGEEMKEHGGWIVAASTFGPILAIIAAAFFYWKRVPEDSAVALFVRSGFGLDALYERLVLEPVRALARWTTVILDRTGIDSVAHGLAAATAALGDSMRVFQTGNLGHYLGYLVLGVVVLIWAVLK
ncbi:MAG: NADH-quinone oxidoreductase subunit L [Candidatus Hydrogenedentota bacterium]|nr:MAG: NADH-quinone oxidoreductase subunit L [Candidatus Hydrogenedentota bacterium]